MDKEENNNVDDVHLFGVRSEEYAARIVKLQEEYLIPLKEDLSDWLNRILVIDGLNADTFMHKLDNGVIICKLAKAIEESCNIELSQLNTARGTPSARNYRSASVCSFSSSPSPSSCQSSISVANQRIVSTSGVGTPNGKFSERQEKNGIKEGEETGAKKLTDEKKVNGDNRGDDNNVDENKKRRSSLKVTSRYPKGKDESPMATTTTTKHKEIVCISAKKMKCWENAKSESFYARDNVSNFINWARALGVRDAVAFETEDLVLHNNPRNVVLCLLEVARIACNKYNFGPAPGLVQFEREIDKEIEAEGEGVAIVSGSQVVQKNGSPAKLSTPSRSQALSLNGTNGNTSGAHHGPDDETDGWSSVSQDNTTHMGRTPSVTSISSTSVGSSIENPSTIYGANPSKGASQLDQKVMLIAKSYYGKKVKHGVQRLAEGKYRIAGKIVFVRLLKDRHVMVRVGGGWDTLQHFLERHGAESVEDISPSDLLPMDTRPSESTSRRRSSQTSLNDVTPVTPLRRCMSSTPVSRSTMSSPEPWMSGSSGYSSGSGSGGTKMQSSRPLSRRGSICTSSIPEKSQIPVQSRRKSFGVTGNSGKRASLNLPLTSKTSNGNGSSNGFNTAPSSPTRALSAAEKTSRYPNYLQSSQHITSRPSVARSNSSRNSTIVRRTSLRAF